MRYSQREIDDLFPKIISPGIAPEHELMGGVSNYHDILMYVISSLLSEENGILNDRFSIIERCRYRVP